jgi:anion-transporting  ArsA/GET3 family ATPase
LQLVLHAHLLDAQETFDALVRRHAPDVDAAQRIFNSRLYRELRGSLAGVLEYMAVERVFDVRSSRRFSRVIVDTPPTRQALDFLDAPGRITGFLDSGALRLALRNWFDAEGHLQPTRRLGALGRGLEAWLDRLVGLGLLRDVAEFFQAFGPLYDGFRSRAQEVSKLLTAPGTQFVLLTRPDEERIAETMFFARQLLERRHRLASVVVNMVHPQMPPAAGAPSRAATSCAGSVPGCVAWWRCVSVSRQCPCLPCRCSSTPATLKTLEALRVHVRAVTSS